MKNIITVTLFLLITALSYAQTLTLISPEGLTEPYEVTSGTEVIVQWDYFSSEPSAMFSYSSEPALFDWGFFPNPDWNAYSNWTDNGDGTYNFAYTVNEEVWLFGGFQTFFDYIYSNTIHINIASDVVLTFEDGMICPSGGDTETLTIQGSYSSFEWYQNGVLIDGENATSYDATSAGSYYAIADGVQSNTLIIQDLSIDFSGMLNVDATEITFTANAGMDAYQWFSGTDEANMTAIPGATNQEYTATISGVLTYYHVVGTMGTCDVTSPNNSIDDGMFTAPFITMNADSNEFNNVCEGSLITLSIDANTENFTWYRDGYEAYYSTTSIEITSIWSTGEFYVISHPTQWPEITLQSNTVNASYFEVIEPVLYGEINNSVHCSGEEITIDLADEGYTYFWYAHTNYNYTEDDLIDVPSNSYTFTFSEAIRITVVASFQGCESSTTLFLNGYAQQSIYIGITNYDQQYLCIDSIANIGLASYNAVNYTDFIWYEKIGDNWIEIAVEVSNYYGASEPGIYKLQATSINCPTAIVESNEYQVKDYQERPLYLYADQTEICLGDTANLNIWSSSWTSIQWLKGDIQIGSGGYELIYVPLSGAGTESSTSVTEFNHYVIKARHNSCPNGLKITSNPIVIKPSVNPTVIIDQEVNNYQVALWDSSLFYLDCVGNSLTLSIEDVYDSYQWYSVLYAGIDDYELGDAIPGATSDSVTVVVDVQWVTAEVSLNGCIGYTDPILLDGYAFLDPAVESYNNNQICEGDSALVNLGFPGTWIEFYWTLDGEIIEDSNNDSLWVTEPGMYVIFASPEVCPDAVYTSGIGPTLEIFNAFIFEDVDEFENPFFYAYPWQGNFEYQWYLNGEAIENPSEIAAILWKEGLPAGEITVEIINTDGCTSISEGIMWDPTVGIIENNLSVLSIFPNPSNGLLNINGLDPQSTSSIMLYDSMGKIVKVIEVFDKNIQLDISDLTEGMYLIRVLNSNGKSDTYTVNKL